MLADYADGAPARVRSALRSADLDEPTADRTWVAAQLAKRHAYYKNRIEPLLREAGADTPSPLALAGIMRAIADSEPATITIV
jgi:hypothetical protein